MLIHPGAHENDAERAVRSGLGVIDAVGRLDVRRVKLKARVGVGPLLDSLLDKVAKAEAERREKQRQELLKNQQEKKAKP